MGALGDLGSLDFLKSVDPLAVSVCGVHEMHGGKD